ncbi:intracellular serine protease [Colletotrichum asianum]
MSDSHGREFEDDSDEYSDDETTYTTKRREQAVAVLRSLKSVASKSDIDGFWDDYADVVFQKPDNTVSTTFFHRIVHEVAKSKEENGITASFIRPLFMKLVERAPHLLEETDENGETPLYSAIRMRKARTWWLIDYMLQCCDDDCVQRHIINALKQTGARGQLTKTCLNLALEHVISGSVLHKLVENANAEVLGLLDTSKKAAFFHAVRYDQCDENRVELIDLLLNKDMEITKRIGPPGLTRPHVATFLDLKYVTSKEVQGSAIEHIYSVYSEHERSRSAYLDAWKKSTEAKTRTSKNELSNKTREFNTEHKTTDLQKDISIPPKKSKGHTSGDQENDSRGKAQDREKSKDEYLSATEEKKRTRKDQKQEHARERMIGLDSSRPGIPRDSRVVVVEAAEGRTETQAISSKGDQTPNTSLKRTNTPKPDFDDHKIKEKKRPLSSGIAKPDPEVLATNSEKILTKLKLHYMRTRDVDLAISFLYGKNIHDVHICFDYVGPRTIKDEEFTRRFGKDSNSGLKFDEVLSYVRFPPVTVELTGKQNAERLGRPNGKLSGHQNRGRHDMEFFFKWLHDKGVRRVLTVEVDDRVDAAHGDGVYNEVPHSDESIQVSLENIVVEHLNWRKTDLDPQVICQANPQKGSQRNNSDASHDYPPQIRSDLREVTLQWSGSIAALRAWSEPEGLPQLPKLEVVYLDSPSLPRLYDSNLYIEKRIQEFETRLNENVILKRANLISLQHREPVASPGSKASSKQEFNLGSSSQSTTRKITVVHGDGRREMKRPTSNGDKPKSPEDGLPDDEHEWVTSISEFSKIMSGLWRKTLEDYEGLGLKDSNHPLVAVTGPQKLQSLAKPVVVALIDDGVHSFDPAFSNRVIEGKTFDYHDGWIGQHYDSARGHGTEMAKLICTVCPMAEIYSIRLKTHTGPDGNSTIDQMSASWAIEAALEKKATIISMSWTIPLPKDGTRQKSKLDAVLQKACKQKVLMFCSPPDSLAKEDHYPWAYKPESMFLIGAAHSDGTQYNLAGNKVDFTFPGVNVNLGFGITQRKGLTKSIALTKESTGSSIATALAAGLAALIISCFKASAIRLITEQSNGYNPKSARVSPGDVERMTQQQVMKEAFARIGNKDRSKFIQVWKMILPDSPFFDEDKEYEDKMAAVIEFCVSIYSHT